MFASCARERLFRREVTEPPSLSLSLSFTLIELTTTSLDAYPFPDNFATAVIVDVAKRSGMVTWVILELITSAYALKATATEPGEQDEEEDGGRRRGRKVELVSRAAQPRHLFTRTIVASFSVVYLR